MIFITGCARSGTTLTTRLLEALGCSLGPAHNVNGLAENLKIREKIVKPHLAEIGCDPLGQNPLPKRSENRPISQLRRRVFVAMGNPKGRWAYKGAKMCLLWQAWSKAFPEAKWVIVRRDAKEIAQSCLRTSFMRAYDTEEGWLEWVAEHEARFEDMKKALNVVEFWPDKYLQDQDELKKMAWSLGLPYDQSVYRIYDDKRWHPTSESDDGGTQKLF